MLHNATNTFISTLARLGGRFLAILDPMRDGQLQREPRNPKPDPANSGPCELRSPIPPDHQSPLKIDSSYYSRVL